MIKTNKYIVLDLDSTLVHSCADMEALNKLKVYSDHTKHNLRQRIYTFDLYDVTEDPGTGQHMRMWGIYRPHWKQFHDFMKSYFAGVVVWSAGRPRYVDAIVNILFNDPDFQPFIVYTSDNCLDEVENIYKPLAHLIDNLNDKTQYPKFTLQNVFVVDDREDTFSHNVENGILIPDYSPDVKEKHILDMSDSCLLKLEKWFLRPEVYNSMDVRTLDKTHIFS